MKKHKSLTVFIILIGIIFITIFYAIKIVPYQLNVEKITLNQPNNSTPVKIVQFSDVHIKNDFTYKNLDKVVQKINEQDPDIVIFSGDLYDHYAKYNDDSHIINELAKIHAKKAKLAVIGNHDYGGGAALQYRNIMNAAGFVLLKNQNYEVSIDNKKILFTGLDDQMLGDSFMPQASTTNYNYKILLSHEPDQVLNYKNYSYNLALAAHSHGGQINIPLLPFINKFILKSKFHSTQYVNGMYDLDNSNIQKLYVNSGIGTTQISARFGVVPKITVFNLYL